jgi:single-stranded DNA-binding protein
MSAHVLISGVLYRQPEQRTSKAGKPFVTATIRAKDGDGAQFWRVTAFLETVCGELLHLSDGDSLSVQGTMKAELYQPDGGEPRISLSVIADAVLALRQPPRERKAEPKPTTSRRRDNADSMSHSGSGETNPELNDAIPF